jgi:hypothetical protein
MGKPGVFKKIDERDKSFRPFKAYRSWSYTTTSSIDADNVDRLLAIKPNPAVYSGNKVTLDTWQTQAESGSLLVNIANDKEPSVIWYSLNHLYYKRAGKPSETFGYADPAAIERTIFDEASAISIPQRKFGEKVKPGSVKWRMRNTATNISMSLYDDGKGNLIDSDLAAPISNELLYLGFNAMTYSKFWLPVATGSWWTTSNNVYESIQVDTTIQELDIKGSNFYITPSKTALELIGKANSYPYGNVALFAANGYVRIPNNDSLNFKRSENFAISVWIGQDSTPTCPDYATVVSKRTNKKDTVFNASKGIHEYADVYSYSSQFPYEIAVVSGSYLLVQQSNGDKVSAVGGSLLPNNTNHVLFQKSGSAIQLYINGALAESKSIPEGNFHNDKDIFIGSLGIDQYGTPKSGFIGSIDEFFIFSKELTQSEITQLAATNSINLMTTNTNAVGNVFYEHGMVVLSDPRPKYTSGSFRLFNDRVYNYKTGETQPGYLEDFYFEYNSTVTLYEHEYICRAKEDEFNFTANTTIRQDNNENTEVPKDFVSNQYFAPYITTVGLYNDKGQLLAVGKLGSPIHKRDDVDLNIIVRFDF